MYTLDKDSNYQDVLRFAGFQADKDWLYIITGRPGPTGKTFMREQLAKNGYKAIEISEDIFDLVTYKDEENHYIVDHTKKQMVIVLNRPLNITQNEKTEDEDWENVNMTVSDLKRILTKLPGDMPVVMPVIPQDDCNDILGFRHIRTAGILFDEYEDDPRVLCLNAAAYGADIEYQVRNKDIVCEKVLF